MLWSFHLHCVETDGSPFSCCKTTSACNSAFFSNLANAIFVQEPWCADHDHELQRMELQIENGVTITTFLSRPQLKQPKLSRTVGRSPSWEASALLAVDWKRRRFLILASLLSETVVNNVNKKWHWFDRCFKFCWSHNICNYAADVCMMRMKSLEYKQQHFLAATCWNQSSGSVIQDERFRRLNRD